MNCQVKIDEARYIKNYSLGDGRVEGWLDISPAVFFSADTEKLEAYRLSQDEKSLDFDPDKWAQIQTQIQQESENPPPTAEDRLAALEALYLESILGGII